MPESITAQVTVTKGNAHGGIAVVRQTLDQVVNLGPVIPPSSLGFSITLHNAMAGFTLPLSSAETYDFIVRWGDGTQDHITVWNQLEATHNYPNNTSFTLTILNGGTLSKFAGNSFGTNVLSLNNWGSFQWTALTNLFGGCINLATIPSSGWDFTLVSDFSQAFLNCQSLGSIPFVSLNVNGAGNFTGMFDGCISLTTTPPLHLTPAGKTLDSLFAFCSGLTSIGLLNFSGGDTSNMFLNCSSLTTIPAIDFTGCTFSSTFDGCSALSSVLATGIADEVSFANCNMNAAALNVLFTNLGTVVGKNINVSGNPGAATCNTALAIAKGWSVTA